MITFLGCEGDWSFASASSPPTCGGELLTFTAQEIVSQQQLTSEDYQLLKDHTLEIFLVVFGFFAIKKLL